MPLHIPSATSTRLMPDHVHDDFGSAAGVISDTLEGGNSLANTNSAMTGAYLLACELQTLSNTNKLARSAIETYQIAMTSSEFLKQHSQGRYMMELPNSATPLRDFIEDPKQAPMDKLLYCIGFVVAKMESRYFRQATLATGHAMTIAGTASMVLGVAAGSSVVAVGIGTTFLPHAYAGIRCLLKNQAGTLGKDRAAVAEYLWGLALAKATRSKKISEDMLSPRAQQALAFIENMKKWNSEIAQDLVVEFLKIIKVINFDEHSEGESLGFTEFARAGGDQNPESGGFVKIMNSIRATP